MGVAVFQSDDGGSTWKQAFRNDPNVAAASDSLPLGGLKDGITPVDMKAATSNYWIDLSRTGGPLSPSARSPLVSIVDSSQPTKKPHIV